MEKENKRHTSEKIKKQKQSDKSSPYYSIWVTLGLALLLVLLLTSIWALFVSGPARIHDQKLAEAEARITEQVPGIEGITQTTFEYITYEGYTPDTLYWFDVTGEMITSREMATLNYNKARETASTFYGVEPQTVQLVYGYTAPAYEIVGEDHYLLLDYDTLALIYERRDVS